jgi:hypothetical protein
MYLRYPDVLRTIQQNLTTEIIPDLSTEYAREQAWGILVLLEHLISSWDRSLDMLRAETDDLRETLEKIAPGSGTHTGADDAASPGQLLLAENRELRARLAATIESAPADAAERRLAEQFMARQLERETAAVANVAPTWD